MVTTTNQRTVQPSKLETDLKYDENEKPKLKLVPMKKTAVQTRTREDFDNLVQVYESGGWKWDFMNALPTTVNIWSYDMEEKTCLDAGISWSDGTIERFDYDSPEVYIGKNHKVITPQEFYNAQNPKITPEIIKEINSWFDENRPNRASKGYNKT
jgi:hypothetical protein